MLGQKFGRLTITKLIQSRSSRLLKAKWECICDCGTVKIILEESLKRGATKSCGCLQKEIAKDIFRKEPGENGFNHLVRDYKRGAKTRDLAFDLNEAQIRTLFKGNCFYCNIEPKQVTQHIKERDNEAFEHFKYIYNGIDRLHNDKGYSLENCVSCCTICNTAKSNMSLEEWIEWLSRITSSNAWKVLLKPTDQ